jgi:superfamily I DNA and/or RNA helicase
VNDDELRKLDCAVVDEASQAVTPALLLLLPFLKYPPGADLSVNGPLLVLAGDHRQLPPTVISG